MHPQQLQQTSVSANASLVQPTALGPPCSVARDLLELQQISNLNGEPANEALKSDLSLALPRQILETFESSNTEAEHNESPIYSPTEDEADDHEPNATDNGGEADLEPMANGAEVGNDGADTGQVVAPMLFDLTFDDAAGKFVRPVSPNSRS